MFSKIQGFLNRHKNKILFGSAVVGAILYVTRYTQKQIRQWQEHEIKDILERTRRREYFEKTETICDQMIQSIAVPLRKSIAQTVDTESILNKLRSHSDDKIALWNQLKVLTITRSVAIVYAQVMLVIIIRIQFNLIGAYTYKTSPNTENTISMENENVQTKYMSLGVYFLCQGIPKLCSFIEKKVAEVTASISLMDLLTLRDVEQIYWATVSSIIADGSKDPIKNLSLYTLPPDYEAENNNMFSTMVDQTFDLLESTEVQSLAQSNIRSGFVLLMDRISQHFSNSVKISKKDNLQCNGSKLSNGIDKLKTHSVSPRSPKSIKNDFVNINTISIHMAKIIPMLKGEIPDIQKSGDLPAEWLKLLILNDKLKILGANIYEAFSF